MKKIDKIYTVLFVVGVALGLAAALSSCSQDDFKVTTSDEGEGALQLSYNLGETRAVVVDPTYEALLAESTLRIYNASNQLIQKYTPATDIPDNIYLVAGEYRATLTAGVSYTATFDSDKRLFYGEEDFTIEAKETEVVEIVCAMLNSAVKVTYDATIATNLEDGYTTYVWANDPFSLEDAQKDEASMLVFTTDSTGYFMLPDGVDNLSWGFYGTGEKVGDVVLTGTVTAPQAATLYTLAFKFSKTPDGFLNLTVDVDEDAEEHDDSFIFSPQPIITGVGFDLEEAQYIVNQELQFTVTSIKDIATVELRTRNSNSDSDMVWQPVADGTVVDLSEEGITYTVIDSQSGVITLSAPLFAKYSTGGAKEIEIIVTDEASSRGTADTEVMVTGILPTFDSDLWYNTATFEALVTNPDASNVEIAYREQGAANWVVLSAIANDNNYRASVEPQYSTSTNASGHTVYQLLSGIKANTTYEVQLTIDEVVYPYATISTAVGHTIPSADMEDGSLSCFTSSNSSSTGWASGNNSMAGSLCKQGTYSGMGGSYCAKLASSDVLLVELAAGNLFMGQFSQSGTSGTASFGQAYTWESRPTTFKVKYAASLGTVDASYHSGAPISDGDTDRGRIFFAIVDWSGRHAVKSGTSSPTGVWNPEEVTSVDEGEIIGYACQLITASTTGDMQTLELPIYYYDTATKPSQDITIVVSCAASAYGDYMTGSTSSVLYVDDFELVY